MIIIFCVYKYPACLVFVMESLFRCHYALEVCLVLFLVFGLLYGF